VVRRIIILVFGVIFTSAYVLRFLWKLCCVEDFYVFRSSYEDGVYNILPLFILGVCSIWVSYVLQVHIIDFCNYLVLRLRFKLLTLLCVILGAGVFFIFQISERTFSIRKLSSFFKKSLLFSLWFKSIRLLSFGSGDSLSSIFISRVKGVILVNVEKGWVENLFWGSGLREMVYFMISFVRRGLLKEIGVGLFFGVVFLFIIFS